MILRPGRLLGGVRRAGGRILVAPGLLSGLTLTRAQAGGMSATNLAADAATWSEVAANVARYFDARQRLLIEGTRQNQNDNPRGEGGSGSTPPTNWGAFPTGAPTREVVGRATINGIDCVLVRFAGTPTTTAAQTWVMGGAGAVVSMGTIVSNQAFIGLYAGSLTNVTTWQFRASSQAGGTSFTPAAGLARITNVRTLTATTSDTTLRWNYADTVAPVDFTLAIGWVCREHAASVSTPILPPAASPALATRSADLVSASLTSLDLPASGVCTLLWSGVLPQAAPTGVDQGLVRIDDGTNNNVFRIRNTGGGSAIVVGRRTGGVFAEATSLGNMTAGTPFAVGMTIDGTGRVAGSLNGGAPQAATGGPTSGLTTLRLGNDNGGNAPMFGLTTGLKLLPYAVPDGQLPALVANFPV